VCAGAILITTAVKVQLSALQRFLPALSNELSTVSVEDCSDWITAAVQHCEACR